jgi:hypothetical protein
MVPDGLRKPNEAFFIAHRGDVVGDDRGHLSHQVGLDLWHRITFGEKPALSIVVGEWVFFGLGSWRGGAAGSAP